MKKLLITLLLISPFSFADWGDVYYCQMTSFSTLSLEGKRTDRILENVQFKLDKTKNAMVFGSSGYFTNHEMKLKPGNHWPSIETWFSDDQFDHAFFEKGKFLYSYTGKAGLSTIHANCDKF
tara:strand:- start:114 stop:479 length:366 start_codon:yes stop_codon:yes gene_type:complete